MLKSLICLLAALLLLAGGDSVVAQNIRQLAQPSNKEQDRQRDPGEHFLPFHKRLPHHDRMHAETVRRRWQSLPERVRERLMHERGDDELDGPAPLRLSGPARHSGLTEAGGLASFGRAQSRRRRLQPQQTADLTPTPPLAARTSSDSVEIAWIANYTSGFLVSSSDYANAVATDPSGNIYVTGRSDRDYVTVKYDSSGVQQWVARYNGPGNSDDAAYAIALDGSGNVYVTGTSWGSGTSFDYATVKYNASGVQGWVARYNGPRNSSDYATAIALDGSGNVYVTGTAAFALGNPYTTIKYRQIITGSSPEPELPREFALHQNYPNPFNPTTIIRFEIPYRSYVTLRMYNLLGTEVATLVDETLDPGTHERTFNAEGFASGLYFYRMHADGFVQTRKLLLVK